jgi:hypothetical protein
MHLEPHAGQDTQSHGYAAAMPPPFVGPPGELTLSSLCWARVALMSLETRGLFCLAGPCTALFVTFTLPLA